MIINVARGIKVYPKILKPCPKPACKLEFEPNKETENRFWIIKIKDRIVAYNMIIFAVKLIKSMFWKRGISMVKYKKNLFCQKDTKRPWLWINEQNIELRTTKIMRVSINFEIYLLTGFTSVSINKIKSVKKIISEMFTKEDVNNLKSKKFVEHKNPNEIKK